MSLRYVRIALAAVLLGCARSTATPASTIHLGAAGPWETSYGRLSKAGIELAVTEINSAGGIDGRRVEVTFRDDQNDGATAAAVARAFVDQPEIVGVIGHLTSSAMASAARVYDGQLAAVSPTTTSPDLVGISDWLFRLSPSDSVTGLRLGRYVRQQLGATRVAVIYENSIYGRGLVESFLVAYGREPVALEPIDYATDSIGPNVRHIARLQPDLVFAAGNGNSALPLYRALRAAGVTVPIISGDGWSALENEPDVTNVQLALPMSVHHTSPATVRFVEAYRRAYNGAVPDAYAALSYDATLTLARAVAAGATRGDVRNALTEVNDERGTVSGAVRFTVSGDPAGRAMHLVRIAGGTVTSAVLQ